MPLYKQIISRAISPRSPGPERCDLGDLGDLGDRCRRTWATDPDLGDRYNSGRYCHPDRAEKRNEINIGENH